MGFLRGQPDWSHAQARTFTGAGESDLEASARHWWPLASLVTGEVHFADDFEAGVLHWQQSFAGAGSSVRLDTTWANSGNQAVRLIADGTGVGQASILRFMDMPFDNLLGLTCWFKAPGARGDLQIRINVFKSLTTQEYRAGIDFANSKLQLYQGGAMVDVVNPINLTAAALGFRMFQLLIDTDLKTYRGVRFGSFEYLTDAPAGSDGATAGLDGLMLTIRYFNNSGTTDTVYVDDCFITRKQP